MLRSGVEESVKRLENMKQATILRYLNNINLENNVDIYDEMIVHFANGELRDYFSSKVLEDLVEEDREDVLDLTNEYMSLCFYEGETDYWTDSIDNVPTNDYELIALKIFDNYDFLLEMARDGGVAALEQMKAFQKCNGYFETSTIDLLRNSFANDGLLKTMILAMSEEDSYYDIFTNSQKAELCRFPEGTLYLYSDGEAELNNPLKLALDLMDSFGENDFAGVEYFSELSLPDVKKALEEIPVELIVAEMSDGYVKEYGHYGSLEENSSKARGMR